MSLSPELLFAAGIAAVAFLLGLLHLRARAKRTRTRSLGRKIEGGPSNLRFTCAGCSGKFTHSRQTLAAWERGNRKFYCKACQTKASTPTGKAGR
jgi:hypothetical protein